MLESRHIYSEKASLPVDVRRSKTSLLKLPTDLTQSISMLSFDCCVCVFFRWSKPVSMSTLFQPYHSMCMSLIQDLFFMWFINKIVRTQGCTGHIIIKLKYYSYHYSYLLPLLSGSTLGSFLLVSIFVRPDLQLWKSQ